MLHKIRQRVEDERGFTLIELLVVILIIGILAAIAIPSFLSQKDKAGDASAKSYVRNMQTAQETYFTDNNTYANSTADLTRIEQTLSDLGENTLATATGDGRSFAVSITSKAGVLYRISRGTDGRITRECSPRDKGGCNGSGTW